MVKDFSDLSLAFFVLFFNLEFFWFWCGIILDLVFFYFFKFENFNCFSLDLQPIVNEGDTSSPRYNSLSFNLYSTVNKFCANVYT
jgi:hypothetical protein